MAVDVFADPEHSRKEFAEPNPWWAKAHTAWRQKTDECSHRGHPEHATKSFMTRVFCLNHNILKYFNWPTCNKNCPGITSHPLLGVLAQSFTSFISPYYATIHTQPRYSRRASTEDANCGGQDFGLISEGRPVCLKAAREERTGTGENKHIITEKFFGCKNLRIMTTGWHHWPHPSNRLRVGTCKIYGS